MTDALKDRVADSTKSAREDALRKMEHFAKKLDSAAYEVRRLAALGVSGDRLAEGVGELTAGLLGNGDYSRLLRDLANLSYMEGSLNIARYEEKEEDS